MSKSALIQARIEPGIKKKAEKILKELGLTTSQAIGIFIKQVVFHKGLPFPVEIPSEPNFETVRAIQDADKGEEKVFDRVSDCLADLKGDLVEWP